MSAERAGLPLKHVRKALMLYLKHIGLTRLGTESGAADFLRSAHATDPSIANFLRSFCEIFADNVKQNLFK